MGILGLIWGRWVHSGMQWGSPGSIRVFGFTWVRHGVVVVFIPSRLVNSGASWGSSGLVRCRWVHLGAPWGPWGLFGVVVFTRVRPWGRRVRSVCLAGAPY